MNTVEASSSLTQQQSHSSASYSLSSPGLPLGSTSCTAEGDDVSVSCAGYHPVHVHDSLRLAIACRHRVPVV